MPRDQNGNTVPLPGTIVSTGDTLLPSQHNPMVNDVYAMMAQSLSRDGQGGMRAPLAMNGFAVQGLPIATLDTDAVSLGQSRANGVPVGVVVDYLAPIAPPIGWIACFGQAISRTEYPDLFTVLGTFYGAGNGSTTFNIPDFRGRVSAGMDDMGGVNAARLSNQYGSVAQALGGTLGTSNHVLTAAQMPAHRHQGNTDVAGEHFHSGITAPVASPGSGSGMVNSSGNLGSQAMTATTGVAGSHSHSFSTDVRGSDQAHPNAQPTFITIKIIKASY